MLSAGTGPVRSCHLFLLLEMHRYENEASLHEDRPGRAGGCFKLHISACLLDEAVIERRAWQYIHSTGSRNQSYLSCGLSASPCRGHAISVAINYALVQSSNPDSRTPARTCTTAVATSIQSAPKITTWFSVLRLSSVSVTLPRPCRIPVVRLTGSESF